jgi:peptide deformylase
MVDIEKCRITHYPAPVLAGRAQPVENIDDSIRKLVEKMTDIMLEHKGIGLAGPQAGVPLRIFIISPDGSRENVNVYINPTVTPTGELQAFEEGCLSVPGVYTKIRRYNKCKVTATDLDGKEFTQEAEAGKGAAA